MREGRSPQLVTLVGVPGIGKSRVVYELSQQVEGEPELIAWRQGRSLPYGDGVTFWARGEIVQIRSGNPRERLDRAGGSKALRGTDRAGVRRSGDAVAACASRPAGSGRSDPVRLRIAALAIRAAIVPEVIDIETGTLGMPANIQRLGWWRDGMAPMARSGTILTAGHYDFATAGRGAFYLLPRARPRRADPDHHCRRRSPHISRRHGGQLSENRLAADRVGRRGPPRLVLVTCGGRFDSATRHFLDNIVVTAVLI